MENDNLIKIFLEEATDSIAVLEKSLLQLEARPADAGQIEQVFRVMHTFKGNSNMFGFEAMGLLTHHLETLYEQIREGSRPLTPELLTLTLKSVDHFKVLLDDPRLESEAAKAAHAALLERVEALTRGAAKGGQCALAAPEAAQAENQAVHTYYLRFCPNADILSNGTNPLYLLDELAGLGTCRTIARTHLTPDLAAIDPTRCYIYWEAVLVTGTGTSGIEDVFMFVEGQCALQIVKLGDGDLFAYPAFAARVDILQQPGHEMAPQELQQLAALAAPAPAGQPAPLLREGKGTGQVKESTTPSIRVASDKLDQLLNLVSELVTTQAQLSLLAEQSSLPGLAVIAENVEKLSRQLRDNTFSICLIPLETIVTRFHRLVRDLAGELGKEIVLLTEGTETEIDKTIIDSLADPLLHMLRNSIDHGIESTHERLRKGKPRQGTIKLKAFYSGSYVHIQVQDDGAGINLRKVRAKALQKGLIVPEASLTEKEILDLIFVPGFSTATRVTDVSGRGVGMDVVRRKISELRGEVEITSREEAGTTFTIKLPLTLSILDGLLVRIGGTHFIIPLSVVGKCYEVAHHKLVGSFNNLLVLDGGQVPFFYLRQEFDVAGEAPAIQQVIVVQYDDKRVGLTVDAIVGEYQAVLKPLGKLYRHQELISGATILGDGTIALVLDTSKIIRQFAQGQASVQSI